MLIYLNKKFIQISFLNMVKVRDSEIKRVFYANGCEINKNFMFPSNYLSTTRYTLITFLPFSLFIQFRRLANIYFLIIAILQSISYISPLQPFSAVAPLVFVLSVSMIREAIEDYLRYRSDEEVNSTITKLGILFWLKKINHFLVIW